MNFVEDDQTEDSSDPGDGTDTEVGIGIMSFGDQGDFVFQTWKELVVIVQKFQVKFNAFFTLSSGNRSATPSRLAL